MIDNTTQQQDSTNPRLKMTTALRDGLIALVGLTVAAGSLLNTEIAMWWLGA